jgi:pyridoxamine 5'-phosphate oxidase
MAIEGDKALFYNDLTLSLAETKSLIEGGASDRRRAAHAPVVATVDAQGAPSQRVMIIRLVDWAKRTLRFHTDARAIKVSEAQNAPVSILFYEPDAKVQIRLSGTGRVENSGPCADAAWDSSTLFARRCYMAESAPGAAVEAPVSGLPAWIEGQQPTAEDITLARTNFAVLHVQFDGIEWLYLANSGHRRARWQWDDCAQDWRGSWLVP